MAADLEAIPKEMKERLESFEESLANLEKVLAPLAVIPSSEIHNKLQPLSRAKIDLIACYALNSMFWMFLNTRGENPKIHPVVQELNRIRNYMERLRQINDRQKAPRLNKEAAKRFTRNALWMPKPKKPAIE